MKEKTRLVVLISGSGSNLQAIIDQCQSGQIDAQVVSVISNCPQARGLERAQQAGIAASCVNHKDFSTRALFESTLAAQIKAAKPDWIVLAGFMRMLGGAFVAEFAGKMINIHPSRLPKFRGLNTHQRAIEEKEREHGASVHFVTEELDGGPVILQSRVSIDATDSASSLAAKVLQTEHRILPQVVKWLCDERLECIPSSANAAETIDNAPSERAELKNKSDFQSNAGFLFDGKPYCAPFELEALP